MKVKDKDLNTPSQDHKDSILPLCNLVLLMVFQYEEYRFILVKKAKSAKNIWEPVIEDVIILGFLMADTSSKLQRIYRFGKICHIFTLY